jgi:hypothetical protein
VDEADVPEAEKARDAVVEEDVVGEDAGVAYEGEFSLAADARRRVSLALVLEVLRQEVRLALVEEPCEGVAELLADADGVVEGFGVAVQSS